MYQCNSRYVKIARIGFWKMWPYSKVLLASHDSYVAMYDWRRTVLAVH